MLVHALRAAMQEALGWENSRGQPTQNNNDDNCKQEAVKRYNLLKKNCDVSVPEKEDRRSATAGKKSPQTVMSQRVAPGAQRAPVIINPLPRTKMHHQPSLPSPPLFLMPAAAGFTHPFTTLTTEAGSRVNKRRRAPCFLCPFHTLSTSTAAGRRRPFPALSMPTASPYHPLAGGFADTVQQNSSQPGTRSQARTGSTVLPLLP